MGYGAGAKAMPVMAASSVDVPGPPPTVATILLFAVAMMETEGGVYGGTFRPA